MNNTRRKAIRNILKELEQAAELIRSSAEQLQLVTEEDQEAFDNMPEGCKCQTVARAWKRE